MNALAPTRLDLTGDRLHPPHLVRAHGADAIATGGRARTLRGTSRAFFERSGGHTPGALARVERRGQGLGLGSDPASPVIAGILPAAA